MTRLVRFLVLESIAEISLTEMQIEQGMRLPLNERRRLLATGPVWTSRGIVTRERWKYLKFPQSGEGEMYRMSRDPFELLRRYGNSRWESKQTHLARLYRQFRNCSGAACH